MWLHCANTAEWIKVPLEVEILADQRNIVLDESPGFRREFDAAFARLLWPLFVYGKC